VIALDTNVLVRFLIEDDEEQSARAAALIRRIVDSEERLFVPELVVCETVWVLAGAYRFQRGEIAALLTDLLSARELEPGGADRLWRALRAYRAGRGDFADYLISEQARDAGFDTVATFDRKLLKDHGFTAP
jgi:predicted nucleic-acid-binding protein